MFLNNENNIFIIFYFLYLVKYNQTYKIYDDRGAKNISKNREFSWCRSILKGNFAEMKRVLNLFVGSIENIYTTVIEISMECYLWLKIYFYTRLSQFEIQTVIFFYFIDN